MSLASSMKQNNGTAHLQRKHNHAEVVDCIYEEKNCISQRYLFCNQVTFGISTLVVLKCLVFCKLMKQRSEFGFMVSIVKLGKGVVFETFRDSVFLKRKSFPTK